MRLKNILLPVIIFPFIFFLGLSNTNAQVKHNNYHSQWKNVEDLQKKELIKSALNEVDKIYNDAKKNDNDPQIIKSLLFKITLQQNIQEDASIKSIDSIEQEITVLKEPSKSILQSIAAQMYWNYFQQNRYKIYQRTNTISFDKKDIATWTSDELNQKISELYLASLKDESLLKQTNLEPFDAIILKGNVRYLRPTLYDLLAHRALDYFKSNERNITRPAYAFEIKDKEAFAPANEFIEHQFLTKDSASLHQKALLIFQDLLDFHKDDKTTDALIDADIERIDFANRYGVMAGKDSLYINALINLNNKYYHNPVSAQASFLAAQATYNNAVAANSNNDSASNYTVVKAKKILNEIVKKYPQSEGGINAQNLLKIILHPSINITTEKVNVPGLPFRALVTYKNSDQVYFRIIPLSKSLKNYLQENTDNDTTFAKLTSEKNILNWKQDLPFTKDYLSHSVEVKVDALPIGEYVLLGSKNENFSMDKNPLAAQYFYVSNISYINSGLQYFVLNRTTGQPLKGATVRAWNQISYNSSTSKDITKKEFFTTDKNGYFSLPRSKDNRNNNVRLNIRYKGDHLFLDNYQYIYNNSYTEEDDDYDDQQDYDDSNAKVFLFTDRSIYRPGQTVYFKGIGVTKDWKTKKTRLLTYKDSVQVFLYDANNQKIDSLNLLLNDFGSINGKFKIPENKLNGEFEINVADFDNSSVYFSIEEYKRPKFYAEFEKAKESYHVGDTVTISGFAKAYAGNNIDGAKVMYHVTRTARFLYPWMFWRTSYPRSNSLEITHGEITTDAEGKFSIQFAAIPDLSIDKNTDPVFDYKIEADVTDINGETRITDITVPVGYKSLNLKIALPQGNVINIDSLKNIFVSSKNLSDQPQKVKASIKIYRLQPLGRLIRKRLWTAPDKFIMPKSEFIQYFPHDEYTDESEKESWPKGPAVFSRTDSIFLNSQFSIPNSQFQQGWYVAEATAKDKYGQEVKDVKYFQVYDKKAASLPAPAYAWSFPEKNYVKPGETGHLITGTSASDVFLIREIDKAKTTNYQQPTTEKPSPDFSYSSLSNSKKSVDFKISEDDRGGFGVNQFFVKDNRFYVMSTAVFVPWDNKQLNISFGTYRNKILPGSKEKWKVKITGNKGKKVAAEMLASMYDASLDQFKPHSWNNLDNIWPTYSEYNSWGGGQNFSTARSFEKYWNEKYIEQKEKRYDALNYLQGGIAGVQIRGNSSTIYNRTMAPSPALNEVVTTGYGLKKIVETKELMSATVDIESSKVATPLDQSQIQIRKNFNETAFFFPDLRTDKDGNIEFSFTMPEALTQWKLMTLAHTKDLASAYTERTIVTQKDLMVQPNPPRFLREGDSMAFTAKIVNLSNKIVNGKAEFHLLDASTMNPVDGWFKNTIPSQNFTAEAGQSTLVKFNIDVPINFNNAVFYRIVAKASPHGEGLEVASDGEEAAIPVVTNRMLVTETMPLPMRGDGTKNFKFEKLLQSSSSPSLTNYGLTVEYTTNPAWYAIQVLPYLMEYPYECAEQTFNRYYANALATEIVNSSPKIKSIFEKWATSDTSALLSDLQKNEELKSVLLEETPWVLQAKSETQQKKNIALLFDLAKMSLKLQSSLDKLTGMQSPDGGFVWFKGGQDDRYITQYIISGIGHLKKLNALPGFQQNELKNILDKAIPYLDKMLKRDYDNLIKNKTKLDQDNLSAIAIQYLYMRSFFPDFPIAKELETAYNYYRDQSKKYWPGQSKYTQAMIALELYRTKDEIIAKAIMQSLKENSIDNEELGMYWKEWNNHGYWWYQQPIESQSLMIEAFSEIDDNSKTVGDLKTWLLKNKQTNNWKTTKATADACYALLLQGTDWLSEEKNVTIKLGSSIISSKDEKQEAGTGYFKKRIEGDNINPRMGNISVTVSSQKGNSKASAFGGGLEKAASWGSVYWQYFENLDKITFSETPLKLSKKLFIEKNTANGPVLIPVKDDDQLHIGDKIKVRIELRADRDMEYVHMKDMRASCMEPTNVISTYKYQDALGYYESTKDVSTNFFFSYLPKGTYVFEYPMFVTHSGDFSNGITTIQCMYAPEFTSHSEGVRVNVIP
ncbi:MAG: MG2 domain-containing protein [Bacteroidota bacterium]|nr:MG2 domain-containing protein [Bacteroidota bacterium]